MKTWDLNNNAVLTRVDLTIVLREVEEEVQGKLRIKL